MAEISEVALIGLGEIGFGAAMSLIEHGYTVYGVDNRQQARDRFEAEGGRICLTPAEAARKSAMVLTFVVNDKQTETVLFGENGAVAAAAPETVFINCSTMQPSAAVRIGQRLVEAGMGVLDAPVTGGPSRASRGELKVMVSGRKKSLDQAEPVLDALASRILNLGSEVGQASQIKMINQMLSGIHIVATAEAMTLGAKCGVDLETMYEVVSHSTGNSWMFENRGAHIVNGDYAPRSAIDIILKDMNNVALEAEVNGVEIPLARAALIQFYEAVSEGYGREDGSAVAKLLARKSGVLMPGMKPQEDQQEDQ